MSTSLRTGLRLLPLSACFLIGTAAIAAPNIARTPYRTTGNLTMAQATFTLRRLNIVRTPYGTTDKGKRISLYTLSNGHGMKVSISTFGAVVTNLFVPDRNGSSADVVLGFGSLKGYEAPGPYFGATVGRYANRIAKGAFKIGRHTYHVPINNGPNSLHGGIVGYDKRVWQATGRETPDGPSVVMRLHDPNGDQGYPGNVNVKVQFTLTNSNALRIQYTATTDRPTPINLTNHSYFNLKDGGASSIEDHVLKLYADQYTPVDSTLIPTGQIAPVAGTPYDFREPKAIGKDIGQTPGAPNNGYDNNFVLRVSKGLHKAADVTEPTTGRHMEVYTTQPGIQFYTSNFLDGTLKGKGGVTYQKHAAFCLETQHFPDSPNHPNFPTSILGPGQTYRQTTEYRFSVK